VCVDTAEYDPLRFALQFIQGFGRLGTFGGRNNESLWRAEICSQRFLYGGSGCLKEHSRQMGCQVRGSVIEVTNRKTIGIPRVAVLWLTKTRS
jgi:hypothetical protein